jgi:hypothetical protein
VLSGVFLLELEMSDRELLELAAKAAGIKLGGETDSGFSIEIESEPYVATWNPLTDDGDALRLAVKLRLRLNREINFGDDIVEVFGPEDDSMSCHCSTESTNGDPYAATRRAIVRAAAEIGRQMQEGGAA